MFHSQSLHLQQYFNHSKNIEVQIKLSQVQKRSETMQHNWEMCWQREVKCCRVSQARLKAPSHQLHRFKLHSQVSDNCYDTSWQRELYQHELVTSIQPKKHTFSSTFNLRSSLWSTSGFSRHDMID